MAFRQVRFLWLWLSLLPFALENSFVSVVVGTWWADKPQPALALAMLFIGFVFLSIEDVLSPRLEPLLARAPTLSPFL